MDFDDSCCFLENNFDQFHLINLLSPNDSEINLNSTTEQTKDQLSEIIDNFGLDLSPQDNNEVFSTYDSSIFDAVTLENDFMNQILYDNASPSTSDSGNYSPTCSTSDDQSAADSDRIINSAQATQVHQLETKFTVAPNPSRLVPVQIPVRQIITKSKSASSQPMICIMPATTHVSSLNSQLAVNQNKQRMLSPKREGPSLAPTLPSTPVKDYDRKKEDRKIRNRYSAQLSRIRKKNEINEMKRNLANKNVIIEKLKNEIEILKRTVETLRNEVYIIFSCVLQTNVISGNSRKHMFNMSQIASHIENPYVSVRYNFQS
ncbi:hypothetical protein LOAG_18332 [Loa loa]|uniref:BZIP domain-containing protein n=1 Tax=Loa loa TaxID=7209 RepID=A0A1S0UFH4_LOALO|nr:hypothetical protein LOAG_18332 [Loa loa]EJD74339.1 hypothetical protein LOAG_18332 [Loa loa]